MSVWYLDLDDELTDAVARFRATSDGNVVLVLPAGSRIGTGSINFRILAREAETRGLALALVSGDAQVRALATSAGLGAYGTVAEAERALGLAPDRPPEDGGSVVPTATGFAVAPRAASGALTDGIAAVPVLPVETDRRTGGESGARRVIGWALRGAVAGGLLAVGLYVAYQALPSATVSLIPGTTQLPPRTVRIVATPDSPEVDPEAGTLPASWRQYPLSITDRFEATGTEDRSTYATGRIRLTNVNTFIGVVVAEGTKVSTNSGIAYRTVEQVSLPRWDGNGAKPAAEVEVRAVKRGPAANTGADTITRIEKGYEEQRIRVTNPDPIENGSRELIRKVTKEDCDEAVGSLRDRLAAEFAAQLTSTPAGTLTLYPESGRLGDLSLSVPCTDLVGQTPEGDGFELTATTTATALEVDTSLLADVAGRHFRLTADPAMRIESGSIVATEGGPPEVTPSSVSFPMSVTAEVQLPVDPALIRAEIAGKGVDEARAILARYGEATLSVWPDFLPIMPADPARITLDIS